jgi:hypothetical protein
MRRLPTIVNIGGASDRGEKLARAPGLLKVIDRAVAQDVDHVGHGAGPAHDHDGRVQGRRFDAAQEGVAVHVRHSQVDENDVRLERRGDPEALLSIRRELDLAADAQQASPQAGSHQCVVVDHENAATLGLGH